MPVLIAIFLLFLIPIILVVLGRFNVRTGYLWFLALGGAAVSWILILISRNPSPLQIILVQWEPTTFFLSTPKLLIDELSWIYAAGISIFPISIVLTDIIQVNDIDADAWATSLAMTGLGVLAIFAANPLTLVLAWVVMDLSETFMLLQRVSTSEQRERVVVALSVRLLGIFLIMAANFVALSQDTVLEFESIPKQVSGLILVAVGLRLGVIPPHQPFFQEPPLRRGLGTIVRLSPVISSLVLLSRLAKVGVPIQWQPFLLVAAVVGAVYGSFSWSQAKNELDGRPFWILGFSSLILVATIYRLPDASIAWGLAMILSGGVLFLTSFRNRFISFILFFGFMGMSLLPFTPSWGGSAIFSQTGILLSIVVMIAHSLLILGFVRHAINQPRNPEEMEPWMAFVYPLGLAAILITHWSQSLILGFFRINGPLPVLMWLAGVIGVVFAAAFLLARNRGVNIQPGIVSSVSSFLSLEWIYNIFWWLYRSLSRLFASISSILEGEGGVLWAMLILILLIALVSQLGTGN